MSDTITQQNLDDLESLVLILSGVVIGLVLIAIIFSIVITICIYRMFKKFSEISLVMKTTRLDVTKTLESVQSALKRNPAIKIDEDGSEQASPIFTRKIFNPIALPFDPSILRESGEYDYNGDRFSSKRRLNGPPVPPRRAHSFYGDY